MTDETQDWMWWVGHDEERYHTPCETREEAAYIAQEQRGGGYIVEALKPANIKISGYFDSGLFIENADDAAWEDHADPDGDYTLFEVTPDQQEDLQAMVRQTMDAWQEKHSLIFTGWKFSAQRNEEYISPAETIREALTPKEPKE